MIRLFVVLIAVANFSSGYGATFIPDQNFRNWLTWNYPNAMNGSFLDESDPAVINTTFLNISYQNIADATGISAFQNLTLLDVGNNQLTGSLYPPPFVQFLICSNNQLSYVNVPPMVQELRIDNNAISGTFDISFLGNLYLFDCSHNQITAITGAPSALLNSVHASHNQITQLLDTHPNSPAAIYDFSHNLITNVSKFGPSELDLSYNQIDSIGELFEQSSNSSTVRLSNNPLSKGIGRLNDELSILEVDSTQLSCLPRLPVGLIQLFCRGSNVNCLPNAPAGLDTNPANYDFNPVECLLGTPCHSPDPRVRVNVYLDGPFDPVSNTMHDSLRVLGILPNTEPYSSLGYSYIGSNASGSSVSSSIFGVSGNDAIVDWVLVELRDGNSSLSNTLYSIPALVQRDGDIVGVNGSDTLEFTGMEWGTYFVAVRHRNHLGLIPLNAQQLFSSVVTVDFRMNNLTGCFPNAAIIDWTDFTQRMWCGDVAWDKVVKYTGGSNDRDPILVAIGGNSPTMTLAGVYANEDVNMDGTVKYAGANNDRDRILQTIGGSTPTDTRIQVPQF